MTRLRGIIDVESAWDVIAEAARGGSFVPILGSELSCSPEYNDIPSDEVSLSSFGAISPQLEQLALQRLRIDRSMTVLRAAENPVRTYLEQFEPRVLGEQSTVDAGHELLATGQYETLLANVARLAVHLTVVWAEHLQASPAPIGPTRSEVVAPISSMAPEPAILLHKCLNCCSVLCARFKKDQPNSLKLDQVYSKLLILAFELYRDDFWRMPNPCVSPCKFCEPAHVGNFRDSHRKFVGKHKNLSWLENLTVRTTAPTARAGVRLSHLFWLEGLMRHLLLAGTRAFRTRNELAFLLLLDDNISQLPDLSGDPFEMSLLYNCCTEVASDRATLVDVLRYCEGGAGTLLATPETGQPLYRALAMFLSQVRALLRNEGVDESSAERQVVLSMCLDREMERAMALEFTRFRVALPVYLPVQPVGPPHRHGTTGGGWRPAWLLGNCVQSPGTPPVGYEVETWSHLTDGQDLDLTYDGPLLVKMFGSPLEALPTTLAGSDYGRPNKRLLHRLVLDETDLLSSLFRYLPEAGNVLNTYLGSRSLFFFGQDARRWSGRAPYLLVRSLAGLEYMSSPIAEQDDKTSKRSTSAVSFGELGAIGAAALLKLDISPLEGTLASDQVIQMFMAKVAARALTGGA